MRPWKRLGFLQNPYKPIGLDEPKIRLSNLKLIESIIDPSATLSESISKGIQYLMINPAKDSVCIYRTQDELYIMSNTRYKIELRTIPL